MRQRELLSSGENAMAKANLARMNVESLLDLRDQVDQRLRQHRGELQEQLEKIASLTGERAVRGRRRGASTLRGRKVAPTYLDDFLIDKSARKIRKKRRSKR
jgi:hypothetical protein